MNGIASIEGETGLALSYASASRRAGLAALLTLDATLSGLVRAGRDGLVAEMRLTWWAEALCALDTAPPPAQPVLMALATDVLPFGVTGEALAGMIDGWEALLDAAPLSEQRFGVHARARGANLFLAAGCVLGASARDPLSTAGEGWALADLARHLSNAGERDIAARCALEKLEGATRTHWSRPARALGALTHSARMDLSPRAKPPGAPSRVARLLRHRVTGG